MGVDLLVIVMLLLGVLFLVYFFVRPRKIHLVMPPMCCGHVVSDGQRPEEPKCSKDSGSPYFKSAPDHLLEMTDEDRRKQNFELAMIDALGCQEYAGEIYHLICGRCGDHAFIPDGVIRGFKHKLRHAERDLFDVVEKIRAEYAKEYPDDDQFKS